MTASLWAEFVRTIYLGKYAEQDRLNMRAAGWRDHACTPACTDTPGPIRMGRHDEPVTPGRAT